VVRSVTERDGGASGAIQRRRPELGLWVSQAGAGFGGT
jgi:hypothetical protein